MSLQKINIQNFKLIKKAVIVPGKINQIIGENNNGKTSVLEAIQFAMTGSTDLNIIRQGEDTTEVRLQFTDGLVVKRSLSREKGSKLDVSLNDMSPQKPQSYLNGLVGVGTFNPKEVLDPKKRTEYLMNVIDLKVTKEDIEQMAGDLNVPDFNYDEHGLKIIERASQYFYDQRTVENKALKFAKADVERHEKNLSENPGESKFTESDEDMKEVLRCFKDDFNTLKEKQKKWADRNKDLTEHTKAISEVRDRIQELKNKLDGEEKLLAQGIIINADMKLTLGSEPDIVKEAEEISLNIEGANEELNLRKSIAAFKKEKSFINELKATSDKIETRCKRLTEIYKNISQGLTARLMSKADLPVKGLTFEEGKFKLEGIEVEMLSSSKTLSLALAITKKLNTKSNLICIDGVELLDQATYEELHKEMVKDEFNYFMTKVGPAFKNKIDKVIEMIDGDASMKEIIEETNAPIQ